MSKVLRHLSHQFPLHRPLHGHGDKLSSPSTRAPLHSQRGLVSLAFLQLSSHQELHLSFKLSFFVPVVISTMSPSSDSDFASLSVHSGPSIRSWVTAGLPQKKPPGNMRVDGLKFLDTSRILSTAQSLVFGRDEGAQEDPRISKEITLPDAEDVDKQVEISRDGGCAVPTFEPYTATVPWHKGTRNLFSRFFPRYGNYCGPNYSSGRESGSLHWDKAPTDWLDYCCYRHDMGYDTLDQAKLHNADKEFLTCLQNIPESAKISTVGVTYRTLYVLGLERFLIPYRDILVRKIEEGKRGRETAPDVIVDEVKERNVNMNRNS